MKMKMIQFCFRLLDSCLSYGVKTDNFFFKCRPWNGLCNFRNSDNIMNADLSSTSRSPVFPFTMVQGSSNKNYSRQVLLQIFTVQLHRIDVPQSV